MNRCTILLLAITLLGPGCARYAAVSEKVPKYKPAYVEARPLSHTQQQITAAMRQEKRAPLTSLGHLLSAAEAASQRIARDPSDAAAREDYNFAVSRVFGVMRRAKLEPWSQPLQIPAEQGGYVLTHKRDGRKNWNPALYDFTPADQFDVKGTYVQERTTRAGIGAPLVAIGREDNRAARAEFSLERIYYGVTAVIRFDNRRAVIELLDPLAIERVALGGRTFPLAADFTVPIAVMLASTDTSKLELMRLLRPEKYAETARITRLQPYDPNKTVVLVIHGLKDSPATWAPMLNALRGDEEIRNNYQFWFYSYPSGYPYPYSASILRHELDAIQARYPPQKKMVVIGHSMGGCISRLLITDTTNQRLWLAFAGKPPEQAQISSETRKLLTDALIFRSRPEVGRVIFIAAPLRGSDMAKNWPGRIGSMLVKSPSNLIKAGQDAMKLVTFQGDDLRLNRVPNSVDTLAPNNRFVKAIQAEPIVPGIPYHVISGDRGKGGNRDRTKPVMSDGVVPYWSSHMEGAESELVVPSSHSAHQNPQAIREVGRILQVHAEHPRQGRGRN